MKKILILILFTFILSPCQAFVSFDDEHVSLDFTASENTYVEEKMSENGIRVHTKKSPLSIAPDENDLMKKYERFTNENLGEIGSVLDEYGRELTFNKIIGFSSGVIDVTYQVKNGVVKAIKDTFGGYAEYQRRMQVREITNSTFHSHRNVRDTFFKAKDAQEGRERSFWHGILNFAKDIAEGEVGTEYRSNSFKLIKTITKKKLIKRLIELMQYIAVAAIMVLSIFKLVNKMKESSDLQEAITEPLLTSLIAVIVIFLGDEFMQLSLKLASGIADIVLKFFSDEVEFRKIFILEHWNDYTNEFGYFPTLALSIFDIISQIFVGCFYVILLAYIIFGFIFYPYWVIMAIFQSSLDSALNSYFLWLKANFALVFSPVLLLIFNLISNEIPDENYFIKILTKTLSFYSIPLLTYFILVKIDSVKISKIHA